MKQHLPSNLPELPLENLYPDQHVVKLHEGKYGRWIAEIFNTETQTLVDIIIGPPDSPIETLEMVSRSYPRAKFTPE